MKIEPWELKTICRLNEKDKEAGKRFGKHIKTGIYIMKAKEASVYRAGAIGLNRKNNSVTGEPDMEKGNDAAERFSQYQRVNKNKPKELPWKHIPWIYVFGATLDVEKLAQIGVAENLLHYYLSIRFRQIGSSCYEAGSIEDVIVVGETTMKVLDLYGDAIFGAHGV